MIRTLVAFLMVLVYLAGLLGLAALVGTFIAFGQRQDRDQGRRP